MCFVGTVKPIIKEQHKVLKSLPLLATGVDKAGKREGVNGNAENHLIKNQLSTMIEQEENI